MANAKEIKERMASIEETRKITNAMYLISSSKMKQAKKKLADTEPFFYAMQAEIAITQIVLSSALFPKIARTMGISIPNVPHDVPVANARPHAIKNTIAGSITIAAPA